MPRARKLPVLPDDAAPAVAPPWVPAFVAEVWPAMSVARRLLAMRNAARETLLGFLGYSWWMPTPLIVGRHTRAICDRLTRACDDFARGVSSFLVFSVPFRHGKSDIVSRAFPPYFLGRFAALFPDVIMSGYGASLVESFSRRAKAIVDTLAYRSLWTPADVRLNPANSSASEWSISGSAGQVLAVGLGGALTGRGGSLIVLDDFLKSREEAESSTYRDSTWDSFCNDLMTRRSTPCIVCVTATRWHEDDVIGRIEAAQKDNADFPRFETMVFPATDAATGARLFPERFPEEWYQQQYATLGTYAAAALLDMHPRPRASQQIHQEWFRYFRDGDIPAGSTRSMWIDPAFSKKKTADDAVILIGARDYVGDWWIEEVIHGKFGSEGVVRRAVELARQEPALELFDGIFCEQLQFLQDSFDRAMGESRVFCALREIVPLKGEGPDESISGQPKRRILAVRRHYETGHVFHHERLRGTALERQLQYPGGDHDDCADTAAYFILRSTEPTEREEKIMFEKLPERDQIRIMEECSAPWAHQGDEERRRLAYTF